MSNPYLIEGPAQISFSGGRSSGMMLCKIVEAHGGTLPDDVVVSFANTGKEREETLRFVDRLGEHLGVKVHWIEYRPFDGPQLDRWAEVDFASAARNGEPFEQVITTRGYVPNPVTRICTQNLKIKPMEGLMASLGYGKPKGHGYVNAAGIRADEPIRIGRMRARQDVDFVLPLVEASVTRADVVGFWKGMPFDLELPSHNGETIGGNCDFCYLKGMPKIIALIRQRPEEVNWWIEQERRTGRLFRIDRPNYAALKIIAMQPQFDFGEVTEDALPCECVD